MEGRREGLEITFVHHLYEPGDGGLDRVAITLANGMARRGLPTELWLTRAEGPLADRIAPQVTIRMVPTPIVPSSAIRGRGLALALQIPALAAMIRRYRPRAIFSAGNQSNLSLALARKMAGNVPTKIIQKITNPIERPGPRGKWQWVRERRFGLTAALGDLTFVLSDAAARDYAARYPASAEKFVLSHLACVTPEMLALGEGKKIRATDRPARLLAAGRLAEQKDYPTMIAALGRIKHRDWTLTIIGDGPDRAQVEQLVSSAGLSERVEFAGFAHDVVPFFAKADHLLLSSRWEGLPAVAMEAMATGCGIAATQCSEGLTELLAEAGWQTTPVGDAVQFAAAIERLLDAPVPREKMREIAARYTVDHAVSEHLQYVERLERQA